MGYDIYRFIEGTVKEEFICIICQDVLKEPKMIDKCEHIFCNSCILEWVSHQGICPIDRQSVNCSTDLKEPIRSFKSLLGSLQIKCEFATFGCDEWLKLDELETHAAQCLHNRQDLIKIECLCGQYITKRELEAHQQNCVPYVKREINRINTSINGLKKESTQIVSAPKKTIFQEWNECNRQYVIIKCEMNESTKNETIELIVNGLDSGSNDFLTQIVNKFMNKYKGIWFAFAENIEYDKLSSYTYEKESLLKLKVQSYHITLLKSLRTSMIEIIQMARMLSRPRISKKTMTDSMAETAILYSNSAISSFNSFTEISNAIRERFTDKLKTNWNCYAGNSNYGFAYIYKANSSVTLVYNKMTVIIWQCP